MRNFIFILVFVFGVQSLASVVGKVAAINGKVEAIRSGQSIALKVEDSLHGGDKIKTSKESLVLVFLKNGSSHKLGEKSEMTLGGENSSTILEIVKGSLFSLFKKKKDKSGKRKHFKIKTRTMVAGVRGTQFFTSYGSDKKPNDNWLCVNEGEVEVTMVGKKKSTFVKAGQGISVTKKGVSSPKALPWTKKLNWSMDPKKELKNSVNIESAYSDLLDADYD